MVYSVHLRRSEVAVIVNCPDRAQFTGSRSLKQAVPQGIWLFQESLATAKPLRLMGSKQSALGCLHYSFIGKAALPEVGM